MSGAPEDWKAFYVTSGMLDVEDVGQKAPIALSHVKRGRWLCFSVRREERDGDGWWTFPMEEVVCMHTSVASPDGRRRTLDRRRYDWVDEELVLESGVGRVADPSHDGKLVRSGLVPVGHFTETLRDAYVARDMSFGRDGDLALACLLSIDPVTGERTFGATDSGVCFGAPSGSRANVRIVYETDGGDIVSVDIRW